MISAGDREHRNERLLVWGWLPLVVIVDNVVVILPRPCIACDLKKLLLPEFLLLLLQFKKSKEGKTETCN